MHILSEDIKLQYTAEALLIDRSGAVTRGREGKMMDTGHFTERGGRLSGGGEKKTYEHSFGGFISTSSACVWEDDTRGGIIFKTPSSTLIFIY